MPCGVAKNRRSRYLYTCCCSDASHIWLCDPMGCSMPGFPVLHCLSEFDHSCLLGQWYTQPFHPLSAPSSPAFNLSQHQGFFPNELALRISWPKYWSFNCSISPPNEYSVLISFRIDWFDLLAVQGTHRADSIFCTVATNTTSQSNYILIKTKIVKEKGIKKWSKVTQHSKIFEIEKKIARTYKKQTIK